LDGLQPTAAGAIMSRAAETWQRDPQEVMMRFHPKGLLVVAAFAVLVMLAVDVRWGIAAIAAGIVIDWLFLALPLGLGRSRK
jgi:hypothetical protein